MDYFNTFLANVIPIDLLELLAAIAGSYYIRKKGNVEKVDHYLVSFLWLTFFIEIIGSYVAVAYFSNYTYFEFIKDTVFDDNSWLYNIYTPISFVFFVYYFRSYLSSKISRDILKISIILFIIASTLNLIFSDTFFTTVSVFSTLTGTIILVLAIFLFYFELLNSDKLLSLKYYLPIYISIGALVFNLCITPLDFFLQYFNPDNDLFVIISTKMMLYTNIFMYSTYILGFIICSKKKKSY